MGGRFHWVGQKSNILQKNLNELFGQPIHYANGSDLVPVLWDHIVYWDSLKKTNDVQFEEDTV